MTSSLFGHNFSEAFSIHNIKVRCKMQLFWKVVAHIDSSAIEVVTQFLCRILDRGPNSERVMVHLV